MNNNDDDKFEKLLAELLDKEEMELLKRIVGNRGELKEENNV